MAKKKWSDVMVCVDKKGVILRPKKPKKPQKKVFLVYSACYDQQETFLDAVVARDEEEAKKKVVKLRCSYAFTDYAGTLAEHVEYMQALKKKTLPQVEKDWRDFCRLRK